MYILKMFQKLRSRRSRYFSQLQDFIYHDNLFTLYRAAIIVEVFLACYGVWAVFAFDSTVLNLFYIGCLALNTGLVFAARRGKRRGALSFSQLQLCCMLFDILMLSFIIGISVFPFSDRPSIFYSMPYTIIVILFEFPIYQIVLLLTAGTGVFIGMVLMFKDPVCVTYDLALAITTYLLDFFVLYIVMHLKMRNGEARMELKRQSQIDQLTGLFNRRGMDSVFRSIYINCRKAELPAAVVMLDIDYFKLYNDKFGHPAGDRLLNAVGTLINSYSAHAGGFAARYGGEEFALLFPNCNRQNVQKHAETLFELLQLRSPAGEKVTVSAGIALSEADEDLTLQEIIEKSDEALYCAKEQGRGRFVFYDEPEKYGLKESSI